MNEPVSCVRSDSEYISGRIKDVQQRRILDESARKRRQRKALEALEDDNFQEDPHADLKMNKRAPKFEESVEACMFLMSYFVGHCNLMSKLLLESNKLFLYMINVCCNFIIYIFFVEFSVDNFIDNLNFDS